MCDKHIHEYEEEEEQEQEVGREEGGGSEN